MLSKIENAYLYLLRVLVLIAATVALIGAGYGVMRLAPAAITILSPPSAPTSVPGTSLGDFVSEKQLSGVSTDESAEPEATAPAPPEVQQTAKGLAAYVQTRGLGQSLDAAHVSEYLMQVRSDLPIDDQDNYDKSLNNLIDQLNRSKGTPLSLDTVTELIHWHHDKFKSALDADSANRIQAGATAMQSMLFALAGLGVFILVIFCFIIVKIERNLRLVHTTAVATSAGPNQS